MKNITDIKLKDITLRDFFAASSISGIISSDDGIIMDKQIAMISYKIADAMLEEREK